VSHPSSTLDPTIKAEILALYAEIDAAVAAAGPRCDSSGKCCHFREYGHVLYLTELEAQVLLESAPPYTQPIDSGGCPFQINNLCTAREPRPLGCRIYFCDPTYQDTGNALMESALARLRTLSDTHGLEWRYAPLHVFLNEADRSEFPVLESAPSSPNGRRSLPLTAD